MLSSGCQSHFAVLEWRVAKHGGSKSISTVNDLQVVSYNIFLDSKEMNDNSCLAAQYKWARSSE